MPRPAGAPIDPTFYLSKTASNIISSIIFGDRFDYEDEEFLSLLRMMNQMNRFAASRTGQVTDRSSACCPSSVPHRLYPHRTRATSTLLSSPHTSPSDYWAFTSAPAGALRYSESSDIRVSQKRA